MRRQELATTGIQIPPLIFGTSSLGTMHEASSDHDKWETVGEMFRQMPAPVVLDTAGKYGAGMALETIGACLRELKIDPRQVVISNKLGWERVPLAGSEPTFEPAVWGGLSHDARHAIDAAGIRRCWEQGCELLGSQYRPQMVAVHDPDDYLAAAESDDARRARWDDILGACQTLQELKDEGSVAAIGVRAKDWMFIRELTDRVRLDWVMLACSFTLYDHPQEVLDLIEQLHQRGISVINSAVFNAGFLLGGPLFDHRVPHPDNPADEPLFIWRARFLSCCRQHQVLPAAACVQFALSPPGVMAVALNTSRPARIRQNVEFVKARIPSVFWQELKAEGLLAEDYACLTSPSP